MAERVEAVRSEQRTRCARRDIDVCAAAQREETRRDARCEMGVAAECGDGDEVERSRMREDQTQCERIVDVATDIGIEEDRARHCAAPLFGPTEPGETEPLLLLERSRGLLQLVA